jgi:hypothetical protein
VALWSNESYRIEYPRRQLLGISANLQNGADFGAPVFTFLLGAWLETWLACRRNGIAGGGTWAGRQEEVGWNMIPLGTLPGGPGPATQARARVFGST